MTRRPSALAPRTPADLARRLRAPQLVTASARPLVPVVRVIERVGYRVRVELACGHDVLISYRAKRARCRTCRRTS